MALQTRAQFDLLDLLRTGILLIMTIGMLVAQFVVSPTIVASFPTFIDYIAKLVVGVVAFGLIVAPVTLVMIAGNLDLSVGSTITLTTIISCNLSSQPLYGSYPGLAIAWAIAAPLLVGAACGAFNGFLVGPMRLNPFIVTLATLYGYQALAIAYNGGVYEKGNRADAAYAFIGRASLGPVPVSLILLAVVFLVFGFLLHRTVFGRRVYAVGGNPVAARFSGIRFERVTVITFVLAGLLAGLSGLFLSSWTMSAEMSVGRGKEFEVITAIILGGVSLTGGKGTMLGALFGVLFMGVLRMFYVQFSISPIYQFVVQGVILIGVVFMNNLVESTKLRKG
jgi:ribose/xylose/arabinose/galactoside ABC-type transport system permease subunit